MKKFLKLLTGGAKSIAKFNAMWDSAAERDWAAARSNLQSGAANLGIEVPSKAAPFEVNLTFLQIEVFSGDGNRIAEALDVCEWQILHGKIGRPADEKCYLIAYFNRLQEVHTGLARSSNECVYDLDRVPGYIKARYPVA